MSDSKQQDKEPRPIFSLPTAAPKGESDFEADVAPSASGGQSVSFGGQPHGSLMGPEHPIFRTHPTPVGSLWASPRYDHIGPPVVGPSFAPPAPTFTWE